MSMLEVTSFKRIAFVSLPHHLIINQSSFSSDKHPFHFAFPPLLSRCFRSVTLKAGHSMAEIGTSSPQLSYSPSTDPHVCGNKRALISLSDKRDLSFLGHGLLGLGYSIVSTGGTASALEEAGISVTKVEELTHFPEMLDGRVKTLHPHIHGGILARRDQQHHMEALNEHGIGTFDIVVVNLYPFYEKVSSTNGIMFEEGIENIDIGGPALIRAAAKNHKDVLVIVDFNDYPALLECLQGKLDGLQFRRELAWKAFQHVSSYDSAVSEWLWKQSGKDKFPPSLTLPLSRKCSLRYGENPHQKAAFYVDKSLAEVKACGIGTAKQYHGKEMSYNNYLDADAAWNCVSEFKQPTCVIVKHTNPCGVASRADILEAYRLAVRADPVSAFGGIVAVNVEIDEALAKEIREFRSPTDGETRMFYEIVIAPKYSERGLEILKGKSKTLRILEAKKSEKGRLSLRQVSGGWLAQDSDDLIPQDIEFNVVSEKVPGEGELHDAEFAWLCVKHVKSNAIVIAKNNCMLGMGSGQPNRVESLRIALRKAGEEVKGAALASDAFFPFAWKDAVEEACESGIGVIAEPGGSIRDGDAIDCCNKYASCFPKHFSPDNAIVPFHKQLTMATLNASHLVSGSSEALPIIKNGASKVFSFRQQIMSHCGLRSLNKVDLLQMQTNPKAAFRPMRRKDVKNENGRQRGVVVCGTGMNIVFVSAEVGPWSKTGGLGDVLGGLPSAMAANGHRVMTVSPRYDQYKDSWDTSVLVELKVGDRIETVRFFHCYKRGVDRVFVDHPIFLEKVWGKTGGKIYGPATGNDYKDNQLRFSLLCLAALEAPRVLNLNSSKYFSGPYGEDVVFVANDWHTALVPCYLKSMYQPNGLYKNAKVVFCIHNIAYQGRFGFPDFSLLNLPDKFKSSFDFIDGYDKPVKGRKINWMKAGIIESDRVLTVSPYYAQELLSGEDRGVELDTIIRKTGITGIVNGMDVQEWNPSSDKYIDVKYDATTVSKAKPLLKEALQAEVGLPVDRDAPLIGFIGRLEEQKGSDILAAAVPEFIGENVQLVILGTGKKNMEKQIEQLEVMYPDKARGVAKFNVPLAHMITAGADFMMVSSRFEPCGLIQLHAMRYGTVPIVASTGGLVDTVKEGFTGFQMGAFNVECETVDPLDVSAIASTVKRALGVYGTPAFTEMISNCMAQDFSWKEPAKKWEDVLLSLEVAGSEPGIDGEEIAPLAKENVATP